MSFNKLGPGKNAPDTVDVIIEIAANSDPVKYEVDKDTGLLHVDRFLSTAMHYPCNYGYVAGTLCDDGDPADVLVVTPFPLQPGSVISARPIGLLGMEDEKGIDHKVLAVPTSDMTPIYDHVQAPQDLPESLINSISHFFEHYKDLDSNKWVKLTGWQDAAAARKEIADSIAAHAAKDES